MYNSTPRGIRFCTKCEESELGDEYHVLYVCKNQEIRGLRNQFCSLQYTVTTYYLTWRGRVTSTSCFFVYNMTKRNLSAVGPEVPPWTRLVDFIREVVKAPGTKALCREGGCGVCTVVATAPDHENEGRTKTFSVQAVSEGTRQCKEKANKKKKENEGNRTRMDTIEHA